MGQQEIISAMQQELRRGTLVLCVLKELLEPMYGYSLIGTMEQKGIKLEANTLYPLMRRLEGQGLLTSEWETSGAKPRKYYRITDKGLKKLGEFENDWQQLLRVHEFITRKENSDDEN